MEERNRREEEKRSRSFHPSGPLSNAQRGENKDSESTGRKYVYTVRMYVCVCKFMYVSTYVDVGTYVHLCMYVRIRTYI